MQWGVRGQRSGVYRCSPALSSWPPSVRTRSCSPVRTRPGSPSPGRPQPSFHAPAPSVSRSACASADWFWGRDSLGWVWARDETLRVSTCCSPEEVVVSPQNTIAVPQVNPGVNHRPVHTRPATVKQHSITISHTNQTQDLKPLQVTGQYKNAFKILYILKLQNTLNVLCCYLKIKTITITEINIKNLFLFFLLVAQATFQIFI